ncbi:hypothetical protein THAOC_04567 [Thalassiosira oceanica]|uniref:CNNM transmembrane domain-containing protein n=1 Tax=Thalassiosira oceanica TaxID=159749 RepID=K0TIY7_THAOC|nr:hypothetical protein THAOC_04567 [Thalassiosira oceanica]|eukprot:EJK73791.1 hypothetical protein THAOC_04567 [Thalassiosira oceanica]
MANPIKQLPERQIYEKADFVERLHLNACYSDQRILAGILGELLHNSIRHTYEMSSDVSNMVELPVAAEECPIDVIVMLRGAVGALASSYILAYDLYAPARLLTVVELRAAWRILIGTTPATPVNGSSDGAAAKLGDDPVPSRKKIVSLILDGHDFYEGEQLFLLQSTGRPGEYKAVRHAPSGRALEGISLDVTVIKSSVRNATEEQAEQQSPIVGGDEEKGSEEEDDGFKKKVFSGVISLLCILCAATAAGLTLGMLSLDPLSLEIKRRASSDSAEREWSERLLPLLVGHSSRHRLLVSLLLLNSLANEALPIFLDELFPSKYASILVSVCFVLFFGEILPSAIFTGPDQVRMASTMVPLARLVMFIVSPVAIPIAKLLDHVLHDDEGGHPEGGATQQQYQQGQTDVTEGNYYNRDELSALVRIQYEAQMMAKRRWKAAHRATLENVPSSVSDKDGKPAYRSIRGVARDLMGGRAAAEMLPSTLDATPEEAVESIRSDSVRSDSVRSIHRDEITMIEGALSMTTKVAADVYTPLRSPSADCGQPRGVPATQHAAAQRAKLRQSFDESSRSDQSVPGAWGSGRGGMHLALVCARPMLATAALGKGEAVPKEAGVVGIITLEDVIEELLQEEIYDETDRDIELARWGWNKWVLYVKRRRTRKLARGGSGAASEDTPLLPK